MKFQTCVLLAAVIAAGCGQKDNSAAPPAASKPKAVSISDAGAQPVPGEEANPAPAAGVTADAGSDIDPAIKAAIQKYVAQKRASPRSWIDLTVEQGYLDRIPTGKDGQPLDFDKTIARLNLKPE